MSVTDDSFFAENIVNINKKINIILFCAIAVPVCFVLLTYVGVWYVPTSYAIVVFVFTTIMAVICFFMNRSSSKTIQYISMYLGLFGISGIVFFLGMKGVIVLTLSYAVAPFISCLYYNPRLTRITTIVNFVFTVLGFKLRSSGVTLLVSGIRSPERWFLENVPGVIVEFIFVFLATDFLSKRTYQTFRRLMSINADKDGAYRRLNEKTIEQFNTNKELQEKNEYIEKLNTELNSRNVKLNANQHKIIKFVGTSFSAIDITGITHNYHVGRFVQEICKQLRSKGYYSE